jgi:glutamyl-tRNA reductase
MAKRLPGDFGRRVQPYVHSGRAAALHLFRVAVGRESLVVGERQIAGQFFGALEAARTRGSSSRTLNGLGSIAGRLVHIADRRCCLGDRARGIHGLAVAYLRERFDQDNVCRVVLAGTGAIGNLARGLLEQDERFKVTCCNRTVPRANTGGILPLDQLPELLADADAVVVCTGAPGPVLHAAMLSPRPEDHPLHILDLGVPEQVERESLPEGVFRAGIDELTTEAGAGSACGAEAEVDELVQRAVTEFARFCGEPEYAEILSAVQDHHQQVLHEEIPDLVRGRLSYLSDDDRAKVEADLDGILHHHTSTLFRRIREQCRNRTEEEL